MRFRRKHRGQTFVEILIAVVIVGMLAALVMPSQRPGDLVRLEQAVSEVCLAVRFAQSEATRTRVPYGVFVDDVTQRLRVYRLDENVTPPVAIYDVRNPMDKKLYELKFDTDRVFAGVSVDGVNLDFNGFGASTLLSFGPRGTPEYRDQTGRFRLNSGTIVMSSGEHVAAISIAPYTGRVTVP